MLPRRGHSRNSSVQETWWPFSLEPHQRGDRSRAGTAYLDRHPELNPLNGQRASACSSSDAANATTTRTTQRGSAPSAAIMATRLANYRRMREYIGRVDELLGDVSGEPDSAVDLESAFAAYCKVRGRCLALGWAWVTRMRNGEERGQAEERVDGHALSNSASGHGQVRTNSRTSRRTMTRDEHTTESPETGDGARRSSPANEQSARTASSASLTAVEDERNRMKGPNAQSPSRAEDEEVSDDAWLAAIRDWKTCVERLLEAYQLSLAGIYGQYDPDADSSTVERLFSDKQFREQAIRRMASSLVYRRNIAPSDQWPKHEARFQHYEQLEEYFEEISDMAKTAEAQTSHESMVLDFLIEPRGDAILQFANTSSEGAEPVLRFLVSSHMLAATSPIFARMFSNSGAGNGHIENADDEDDLESFLPPPPELVTLSDGSSALLYHMPQLESNKESSLSILLHAAHLHNEHIPREIPFGQFVAVAEAALRYRCTAPLELVVEYRWLPQWVHKATEPMPDGLLMISYVFGLRRMFTRMSKTAILNIVDEYELARKDWPQRIKDRLWAVRQAKMEQVYAACQAAVEEYLRPPARSVVDNHDDADEEEVRNGGRAGEDGWDDNVPATSTSVVLPDETTRRYSIFSTAASTISAAATVVTSTTASATTPSSASGGTNRLPSPARQFERINPTPLTLTSTPRCPKGSHWCDATNLGWLLLVYNELQLLGTVLQPGLLRPRVGAGADCTMKPPARSLAGLVDALRSVSSPPNSAHIHAGVGAGTRTAGGPTSSVCDPAPAFRTAINDVYNSVTGLTLHEVDGRRHGWALSRRKRNEPQAVLRVGMLRRFGPDDSEEEKRRSVGEQYSSAMDALSKLMAGSAGVANAGGHHDAVRRDDVDPVAAVLQDEGICLRILGYLDGLDDLHAAARVNRAFHSAFKANELLVIRRILRNEGQRRRQSKHKRGSSSHSSSDWNQNNGGGVFSQEGDSHAAAGSGTDTLVPAVVDEVSVEIHKVPRAEGDDIRARNAATDYDGEGSSTAGEPTEAGGDTDDEYDDALDHVSDASASAGPAQPCYADVRGSLGLLEDLAHLNTHGHADADADAQADKDSPVGAHADANTHTDTDSHTDTDCHVDARADARMTLEEAHRILWPDGWDDGGPRAPPVMVVPDPRATQEGTAMKRHFPASRSSGGGSGAVDVPEKFLASEVFVVEEKMLVVTGEKQLSVDYERRVGLV